MLCCFFYAQSVWNIAVDPTECTKQSFKRSCAWATAENGADHVKNRLFQIKQFPPVCRMNCICRTIICIYKRQRLFSKFLPKCQQILVVVLSRDQWLPFLHLRRASGQCIADPAEKPESVGTWDLIVILKEWIVYLLAEFDLAIDTVCSRH